MRLMCLFALSALAACGGGPVDLTDSGAATTPSSQTTDPAPQCEPVDSTGLCGDRAAIIRALVSIPSGASVTTGTLFVGLTHEYLGSGSAGGVYHISTTVPNVDLADGPVSVELDMCQGGVMWSEENCSYQLFAFLDQDGNASSGNLLPDPGEPASRQKGVELSCSGKSECYELELKCEAGASCVQFDEPTDACECAADSCASDFVTCL